MTEKEIIQKAYKSSWAIPEPERKIIFKAIQIADNYVKLNEENSLVEIPCKIGDTVYVKLSDYANVRYAEAEVRDYTHFITCGFCIVVTSKHFDKQNIPFTEFGKTVFTKKPKN